MESRGARRGVFGAGQGWCQQGPLAGTVVRRGTAVGVPTPTFDTLYAVLRIRALSFGGVS